MASFNNFVFSTSIKDLPEGILAIIVRSVFDTFGIAAVGATTRMGRIVSKYARHHWCAASDGPKARLIFNGTTVSPEGAAFCSAFNIDSINGHDGYSPAKGHAGSAVLPALLAFCEDRKFAGNPVTADEFLTTMAVGYEVSYRAGLALHATTGDYHTSGAWTALGVAAMGAQLLGLSGDQLRHAVGIAEYHGPRSQMMRCIDHPSNLRDGVGWGAPTGVAAVYMAKMGFTGAPAITIERQDAAEFWQDLGQTWEIRFTNFKRYPVCRWAHPAIDASRYLMKKHDLESSDIAKIRIQTFHNATRLAGHSPQNVDELAYSIAFPTATMIVRGKIGMTELLPGILDDPEINRLAMATELVETEHFNKISTRERWADVTFCLKDGHEVQSPPCKPKGDQIDDPLSDEEISTKFHQFADPVLGPQRASRIEQAVSSMIDDTSLDWFDKLIYAAP